MGLELKTAFGKVLRRYRIRSGLTQEQLGFEADLRRTYVSIIELGQQQPSLGTVFKLARALGVRPALLIQDVDELLAGRVAEASGDPEKSTEKPDFHGRP